MIKMGFKKYDIFNVNNNIFGEDFVVYNYEEHEDKNIYYLKSKVIKCSCPHCGTISNSLHATCTRTIQFIPLHLKPTYINVNFYKFNCLYFTSKFKKYQLIAYYFVTTT